MTESVVVPSLTMTMDSYKSRGVKTVDITWDPAASVDIYLQDALIESGVSSQPFQDTHGKGGGSYTYYICLAGTTTCTASQTAVF